MIFKAVSNSICNANYEQHSIRVLQQHRTSPYMSESPSYTDRSIESSYQGQNQPTSESLVIAILDAVADAAGVEPAALDRPLYEVIDPDALSQLFHTLDGSVDGYVAFTYYGYRVVAYSDGSVEVYEQD